MFKVGTCLIIAAAFAVGSVQAAQPGFGDRTPPGSFLKWRVSSPQQLSAQLKGVNEVGIRYAAFFKKDAGQLADKFANFQLKALSSDLRTRVYFVGRGGRILSEYRTLKKGSLVFLSETGKPLLDARCGNPLATDIPTSLAQKPQTAPKIATETPVSSQIPAAAEGADIPAGVQLAEAAPIAPEPVMTQVLAQPAEVLTTETIAPTVAAVAPVATEVVIPPVVSAGSRGPFGLLFLPLLLAGGGGGGGGTNPLPPVVPEPASVMTIASSLIGFGLMVRPRSKRG